MSEELENDNRGSIGSYTCTCNTTSTTAACCASTADHHLGVCEFWPERSSNHSLLCTGRILRLTVHLNKVCANRLINMAVVICDATAGPTGQTLGYKVVSVPTPSGDSCNNAIGLDVKGFCFAIPGDPCEVKLISVKVVAQYVPTTPATPAAPVACSTLV